MIRTQMPVLRASVAILCALLPCTARADVLDPFDFNSLGMLSLASGNFTIDTDALVIVDNTDPNTPLFTGVIDNQGGMADSFGPGVDVTTIGPLGVPHIGVFTFDAIDLANSANITVTGHRALALLSHGEAQFATTIDVSGGDATDGLFASAGQSGGGGPGGFAGGGRGQEGFGPGGGGLGTGFTPRGGGAGFGSDGLNGSPSGTAGVSYGSLDGLLQGGSGGGGTSSDDIYGAAGGGGGGAIEIGAAGRLTFVDASIVANGGVGGGDNSFTTSYGGDGSGGGVRLHGASIEILGTTNIQAMGTGPGGSAPFGGGGRVLIPAGQTSVVVGDPLDVSTLLGAIDVSPSDSPLNHGVVTVLPELTIVPGGEFHLLGQATELQTATTTQPRVEVLAGNLQVTGSGTLNVPLGSNTNSHSIELRSLAASIATSLGYREIINTGELRGTGSISVAVVNAAGGEINLINDQLTFNFFTVTNSAGGQINAINSTLIFDAGLTNNGELNLINSSIVGSVSSTVTTTATLVGANSISGDYAMTAGDSLFIDLGGTLPGEFDTLTIGGNATVAGNLNVSLDPGFSLALGNSFQIVDVTGTTTSEFNGLSDGALVGDFDGVPLFIDYDDDGVALVATLAGDFDLDFDVDGEDFLFWQRNPGIGNLSDWEANYGTVLPPPLAAAAATVPEPAGAALIAVATFLLLNRGGRRVRGGTF